MKDFLNRGMVRRIRQHHAIEHATITILMRRNPGLQLVGGRSTHCGFYVYGDVETTELEAAAQEALDRLQSGEKHLAIHANCGTNLVATGTLAGLAVFTTSALGRQRRASLFDQIPAAILAATAALLAGRPAGRWLQGRVTTLADVEDLRLGQVRREQIRRWMQPFVELEATTRCLPGESP